MNETIKARVRAFLSGAGDAGTDGTLLTGCAELYRAAGDTACRDHVLRVLAECVTPEGDLAGRLAGTDLLTRANVGRNLFFAFDETGDERYRLAADKLSEALGKPGADDKDLCPKALYMAQPFRVAYDMRWGGKIAAPEIVAVFRKAHEHIRDSLCDPEPMGWYLMALIDCADLMEEQLYEHYRALVDLYRETAPAAPLCGNLMIVRSVYKGIRLGLLDEDTYIRPAAKAYEALRGEELFPDAADGTDAGIRLMALSEIEEAAR